MKFKFKTPLFFKIRIVIIDNLQYINNIIKILLTNRSN